MLNFPGGASPEPRSGPPTLWMLTMWPYIEKGCAPLVWAIRRKAALVREHSKITANHNISIHEDFPSARSRFKSRKPPLKQGLCTSCLQLLSYREMVGECWSV